MTGRKKDSWRVVKSFSLAPEDCTALEEVQERISLTIKGMNESEIVRAGIRALLRLPRKDLEEIVNAIPRRRGGPVKMR